jgi:hypothetical protein
MNELMIARLCDHPFARQFLTEQTLNSIYPCTWIRSTHFYCSDPLGANIFLAEPFGRASIQELRDFLVFLSLKKQWAILLWTCDVPFERDNLEGHLIFDIYGGGKLPSCGYGFDTATYGPHLINTWCPASRRAYSASFLGTMGTHPIRRFLDAEILKQRSDIFIEDFDWWSTFSSGETGHLQRLAQRQRTVDILFNSKFVFCPRGKGRSSKRRWEAAYCGSIPILIDDRTNPWGLDGRQSVIYVDAADDQHPQIIAQHVLDTLDWHLGYADEIQQDMRRFLLSELDSYTMDGTSHTANTLMLTIAEKHWKGVNSGFKA